MKNKRGLVRVIELMLAITLLSGVILYIFANQQTNTLSLEDYIYNYQKELLDDSANNPYNRVNFVIKDCYGDEKCPLTSLSYDTSGDGTIQRDEYLKANEIGLESSLRPKVPVNLNFSIRICPLDATSCNLESEIFTRLLDQDIYVLETLVGSDGIIDESQNLNNTHKKVRVFMWEEYDDFS